MLLKKDLPLLWDLCIWSKLYLNPYLFCKAWPKKAGRFSNEGYEFFSGVWFMASNKDISYYCQVQQWSLPEHRLARKAIAYSCVRSIATSRATKLNKRMSPSCLPLERSTVLPPENTTELSSEKIALADMSINRYKALAWISHVAYLFLWFIRDIFDCRACWNCAYWTRPKWQAVKHHSCA